MKKNFLKPYPDATEIDRLRAFLDQQEHVALVDVLLEQAIRYGAVLQRLRRWHDAEQPDSLPNALREGLRDLVAEAQGVTWQDADGFADGLQIWLDEVEGELGSRDPEAGLALVERFINLDQYFSEHADHDGEVGPVIESACRMWLRIASRVNASGLAADLASHWIERILALVSNDRYGMRRALLDQADLLLDGSGVVRLRALAEGRHDGH